MVPTGAPPLAPNSQAVADTRPARSGGMRFDRNELSGAFGDLGTDLPLLVGMILAARLDTTSVLVLFGAMQIATGIAYRMPMPVQPLKAVAAIVITQRLPAEIIFGGGLAIGVVMLGLSVAGLLDWLARVIPLAVVRGLQFGLGLQLATLALKDFIPAGGTPGYILAGVAFALLLVLLGNRRFPPALFVVALGVAYALAFTLDPASLARGFGLRLPVPHVPRWPDIATGFLLLALPQIPLSLGNSVLATRQLAADLFPGRPPLSVRRIGLTYAMMNLVNPFFSGVPTCHGSGGMAGHYALGGRTGGSVVLYGAFYLALGLLFGAGFLTIANFFPKPVLGVLLLVEALTLLVLVRDLTGRAGDLGLALLVGLVASGLPYGYLIAMVLGAVLAPLMRTGRVKLGG